MPRLASSAPSQTRDPIAIIGIGCRFPGGVRGPAEFWELLRAGVDAVTEVPADRWNAETFYDSRPGQKGKSISRWAGTLDAIDRFDASFFGVSPREAECMDPQQRMLLQATWEAIDDGGELLDARQESAAGVFVGISTYDYALLQSTNSDQSTIDVYSATGGAASIAANRISYCLNLHGPSIAVDTACSSSLVALHLACASLWKGECPLAFVGGVNAIVTPNPFISFSRSGMLSPDGRCKAFDATANGFVRAEGCGVVLLKPLAAALADGNPIYAVIRGTASNQDGRTNGISLPSAAAQEALIREACRLAGVAPSQVQYVEAHGTGTLVGDPIEASALGTALGDGRETGNPLVIGSVKTNIGHMEAGAGIAGLIKTALALKHGKIPPSLHFTNPNPHIDFEKLKLSVAQTLQPFRNGSELPIAGVNSFGFGGTNAHAILQAPPGERKNRSQQTKLPTKRTHLLALSARCAESLRGLAEKYSAFLSDKGEGRGMSLADICHTAGAHRTRHPHRLCVAADSHDEMVEKLQAFVAGEARPGLSTGQAAADLSAVFVFSGQGPQWWAMGRELLEKEPIFRAKIEECDAILSDFADWSLLEELTRDEASSRMAETSIAQPAIFALQVALAALWNSLGIRPAAVVGHSVGEVAAAHVAGVLPLREAARVIFHRGRCMDRAHEKGGMIAAALTWEQAEEIVAPWAERISIAALNSPNSVTISGDAEVIEMITKQLEERSIFCRALRVSYAFHSHQMDPIRDELLLSLGHVETRPAALCLFSAVTGAECMGDDFAAGYWWRNVRQPVRFATAIDALLERGHTLFLEIGPHPALTGSIQECMAHRSLGGTALASLRRKENEVATMLGSLGALHALGGEVNWKTLEPAAAAVRLPSYAWREEQDRHEAAESRESRLGAPPHPFLARRMMAADPTWQTRLDLNAVPFLKDHLVQEHIVFPAAGYVEMALGAAGVLFGGEPSILEEMDFQKALVLKESDDAMRIQLCQHTQDSTFTIASCATATGDAWTVHSIGKMRAYPEAEVLDLGAPESFDIARGEQVASEVIYERFRELGLPYGPMFRCIDTAWRRNGEVLGHVQLPAALEGDAAKYHIHPTVLDACFQLLLLAVPEAESAERQALYLPVQISRLRFFAKPDRKVWCHARLVHRGGRAVVGDIRILDETGRVLIDIEGFRCQAINRGRAGAGGPDDLMYEILWKLRPLTVNGVPSAPADFSIPPAKIAAQVEGLARQLQRSETGRDGDLESQINPLCRLYILDAFRQMGWQLRAGERVTLASLAKRLRVAPRHHQIFARFLSFLEQDGLLRRSPNGWIVRRAVKIPDPETAWRKGLDDFPGMLAEMSLTRTCGRELASVLRGETDPLRLIFPDGSLAAAEHIYQDSVSFRGSNLLVAETVAAVVKYLPEGRTLRVLEIGAGTGGMTSYVLPRLPADRTDYVFSDLSNVFFSKAEQKFFDFPFLRCQQLDIEKPPQEQGFTLGAFDVVLASDAIHATADLRKTLANVRALLAPGGLLVLLEVDRPARWPDLVFGLTEGWWRFTDKDLRPSYPLISGSKWLRLFAETGLLGARAISDRPESAKARQAIFLGSAPPAPSRLTAPAGLDLHRNGSAETWLLFADDNGTADGLATLLEKRGDNVVTVHAGREFRRLSAAAFAIDPASPNDMLRLAAEVRASALAPVSKVIHFWSIDSVSPFRLTPGLLQEAQAKGCYALLHFVQAFAAEPGSELPQLFIVTRGAQAVVPTDTVEVAQASVHGMARVIANEYPKFRCRAIDLTPGGAEDEERLLFRELFADDGEDQVALRGPARYASRIARTSVEPHIRRGKGNRAAKSYRVEIDAPGALDHLILRERAVRKPGPDEVTIEIKAAALNFRDVMKALGIYPGDSDDDTLLGDECSGRIVAVGRNVKHLRVGDAVLTIGPGCFSSHLTMPAALVLRKPARLHEAEAATIPIAFLTAWYALHHLGRMKKGDRVLIQAATGGVGLAAVQLARLAGAEIFGTAGSPEKRSFLRAQGVHHVMDSRSLEFADKVRELTSGKGVDLILNSLAGEAIAAGISVLASGGRFLEIGKRDIYQNSKIGLRPLRNNASFFVIDLADTMRNDPPLVSATLKRLMPLFASGKLHALPFRVFRASQVVSAFRHMSQARHIGKIVLSMEHDHVSPVSAAAVKPPRFRADGSYLIIGGLGGFGLKVAEWMLRHGAGHLVLASRSGAATAEARRAVTALRKLGRVLIVKADVSNARDTARIFRTVARKLPPLRGVLHAAAVIDDGVLAQQTVGRFERVMAPKAAGAWNLHVCSKGLPLDFFVLFSSIATISGSPGQGSYVVANSFVESLAQHRRALGLPALVINWGVLSEVGIVARNEKLTALLAGTGLGGITPALAVEMLGRLLQCDRAQFGVGRVDWQRLADCFAIIGTSPRYSEVVHARDAEQSVDGPSFQQEISALPPAERLAAATERLKDQIAKVLRTSPAKLDIERPLNELGLDSLMGVELLNRIETSLGVSLPPGNLAAGNSISKMAAQILESMPGAAPPPAAVVAATPKPAVAPSCLVLLRAGGSMAPLFCLHPSGGLVNVYENLARLLPPALPVYGLQSRALFGTGIEQPSVAAMAQHYAALIQKEQPRGPIHLFGFSLGGFLAMKIARIMEDAGREVALVGLIDADLRWTEKDYRQKNFYARHIVEVYGMFTRELGLLRPLNEQELEKFADQLGAQIVETPQEMRAEMVLRDLSAHGHLLPGLPDSLVKQYLSLFLIHTNFLLDCAPGVIRAPLAVWAGRHTRDELSAWRDYTTGEFSEDFIDGDHYDLMYPPLVNPIAAQLAAALARPGQISVAPEPELMPA